MPLSEAVSALFTQEYFRFLEGLEGLTDVEREQYMKDYRARQYDAGGRTLVTIPGLSEIVRTEVPYQPGTDEVREYYRAKRANRPPDLPQFVRDEIRRREQVKERIARSPEPAYAQAFGSILTAVDNVQDFMSTVGTFGRLGLWGTQQAVQAIFPGATAGTAKALADVAARRAAATAGAEFAATVAERAAAGNLVARLALNNPALYAAAQKNAVSAAAEAAYRLAFNRAILGTAGRLVARFVPVLGWVLLASDLLNLLSLAAMMATPLYALACAGPTAAVQAGVPAALFKHALKRETWRAHNLNPFSRKAVAARALRAAPRLPNRFNLVEVLQTTDQMFGVGISLGGLVGLMNGVVYGTNEMIQGRSVEWRGPGEIARQAPQIQAGAPQADPGVRKLLQQSGHVLTVAPSMFAVQEHFTEDEHVLAALAMHQASAVIYRFTRSTALPEYVGAAADARWTPPVSVDAVSAAWLESTGRRLEDGARWWFDDAPRETTGARYADWHLEHVPPALRQFLEPRRAAPVAALYGAAVDETWQTLMLIAEQDRDLFRFELSTDARLLSSLAEDGLVLGPGNTEGPVWAWWNDARTELEAQGATSLRPGRWAALAAKHGVALLPLLPPEAPVPAAWGPSGLGEDASLS